MKQCDTVDGRNPAPGMNKNLVNNIINYQPQLVSRISEPSTVSTKLKAPDLNP